jgi:hypothetical protein
MATIRLTNDLASLIRREIAELDWRYRKKLFFCRHPRRYLPPLRDALCILKPLPK